MVGESVDQAEREAVTDSQRDRWEHGADFEVVTADAGHTEVNEPRNGLVDLGVTAGARTETERRRQVDQVDVDASRLAAQPVSEPAQTEHSGRAEDRKPERLDVGVSGVEPVLFDQVVAPRPHRNHRVGDEPIEGGPSPVPARHHRPTFVSIRMILTTTSDIGLLGVDSAETTRSATTGDAPVGASLCQYQPSPCPALAFEGTSSGTCWRHRKRVSRKTGRMDQEARRSIRAALASLDADRIVAAMVGVDLGEWAQQLGATLFVAITNGVAGLDELAERCVEALLQRDWDGDGELAEQLERALNPNANQPSLTVLRVDLDEVADLLETADHETGWIDLDTGNTWTPDLLDNIGEIDEYRPRFDEEPERWLTVASLGPRAAYRDMEQFITTIVDNPDLADRLTIAIDGPGAFRRFKTAIRDTASEDTWYQYSTERRHARTRAWLTQAGYQPTPRHHPPPAT